MSILGSGKIGSGKTETTDRTLAQRSILESATLPVTLLNAEPA